MREWLRLTWGRLAADWRTKPALLAAAVATTVAARLYNLNRSYEVFGDEISYLRLGQSVMEHLRVELYGSAFLLHPPGFFFVEALWFRLFPLRGTLVQEIYSARYLNVALAVVSVVALYYAVRAVSGAGAGFVAAFLFALDPYVIRTNSRLFIETAAVMWVLLGLAVILPAIMHEKRATRPRLAVAAAAFGLAILTKDVAVFISVVPLLVCAALGWGLARRASLAVAAGAAVPYVIYVGIIAGVGLFPEFLDDKLFGGMRLLGVLQVTGFHKAGSVSFTDALAQQLVSLASTYAMLVAGWLFATTFLLVARVKRRNGNRLIAAFLLSVGALSVYVIFIGTLEDQMFYFPLILDVLGVAVALAQLPEWLRTRSTRAAARLSETAARRPRAVAPLEMLWWTARARASAVAPAVAAVCIASLIAFSTIAWFRTHTTPDDGYEQMLAWAHNLPVGTSIATTNDVQSFILADRFRTGVWSTPQTVCANNATYVVLSEKMLDNGYSMATPEFAAWLSANATVVYSTHTPSLGLLIVYRFPGSWPVHCPSVLAYRGGPVA